MVVFVWGYIIYVYVCRWLYHVLHDCLPKLLFLYSQERSRTNVVVVAKPSANPPTWSHTVANTRDSNHSPAKRADVPSRERSIFDATLKHNMLAWMQPSTTTQVPFPLYHLQGPLRSHRSRLDRPRRTRSRLQHSNFPPIPITCRLLPFSRNDTALTCRILKNYCSRLLQPPAYLLVRQC